jgi:hypothetical protein
MSEPSLWSGRSVHTIRQSAGMDQRRHHRLGLVPARVCGTPSAAARPRYRAAADQASRSSHMIWLIGRLISGNSDGANDGGGDIPSGASASGDDTAGGCQGHRLRRLQHRQRHLRRQHQQDRRPGLLARRPAPFLRKCLEHEPRQEPQAKPLLRQFSASSACVSPIYGIGAS